MAVERLDTIGRLTFATLIWLALSASVAQAGFSGLIVRAESLDAGVVSATIPFANGPVVDTRALHASTRLLPYEDGDLILFDPVSGRATIADKSVELLALRNLIPGDGPATHRLGPLLPTDGTVAYFEGNAARGDEEGPATAQRIIFESPLGVSHEYFLEQAQSVPEPQPLVLLFCGLGWLASRSRPTARTPSPGRALGHASR